MTDIYSQRRQRLKKKIEKPDVDALLVLSPANRYYLSGFELHDPQCNESAGCLLLTPDDDLLFTDARYLDEGRKHFSEERIFVYSKDRYRQIRECIKQRKIDRLGFEPQWMSHEFHASLSEELEMVPLKGFVEDMRLIKDESEIEKLRRSCALNHKVFALMEQKSCLGLSEKEVAWEAEKLFRENGAQELSFAVIAAFGLNSALPHATPCDTMVLDNQPLLLDMGCRLDDYCSDQSRTFWMGSKEHDFFTRTKDLVRIAQDMAIAWIGPGKSIREAYNIATGFFAEHGVEKHFTHSLGHGIGLETHEAPSLGPNAQGEFLPGMVITVEPGLYYSGWGGVRWEYMVLITEEGSEVL